MAGKFAFTQISKYTEALIKLLQWHQHWIVNPIHDMVKVEL